MTPDKFPQSVAFAESLEKALSGKLRVLDRSLSSAAFEASAYEDNFNLSLEESKNIGTAIGCSYFVIVRAKTLRRYSLEKKEHYESYAAVYGVDTRTGRLIFWGLVTREAPEADHAEKLLQESAAGIASGLVKAIGAETRSGPNQPADFEVDELPEESSDAAGEFRPPLPYRRLRPEYTPAAELYGIEATIDILVEIDEKGKVLSTVISRWAGFGLDESVEKTVRAMQWRPASRAGKPFPMRVLLRYNFKKLAKD